MKRGTGFIVAMLFACFLLANGGRAFAEEVPSGECTAGVADGYVTFDAAPCSGNCETR